MDRAGGIIIDHPVSSLSSASAALLCTAQKRGQLDAGWTLAGRWLDTDRRTEDCIRACDRVLLMDEKTKTPPLPSALHGAVRKDRTLSGGDGAVTEREGRAPVQISRGGHEPDSPEAEMNRISTRPPRPGHHKPQGAVETGRRDRRWFPGTYMC